MRIKAWLEAGGALAIAFAATSVTAVDIAGVWEGEQKCDVYDGSKFDTKFKNDTMFISQEGSSVTAAALCVPEGCFLLYQGIVVDDDKHPGKKGQAGLTACGIGPSDPYHETVRADKLEIKKNGKDEFEATSIYFQTVEPYPIQVGTCTWKYKRVAAVVLDPPVPSCGEIETSTLTAPAAAARGSSQLRRP